jgi:hypothetical protein
MRQDPSAVPHPRASYEQISYQQDLYQQNQDLYQQDQHPTAQHPTAQQPAARQSPPWQPPDQQRPNQQRPNQQRPNQWSPYQQASPIYPATEATLVRIRLAQRKARRMQVVSALLGACAAAIFLVAATSHQLDAQIELLTPVLLLSSAANTRRYAQRLAKYRAAEADILARTR